MSLPEETRRKRLEGTQWKEIMVHPDVVAEAERLRQGGDGDGVRGWKCAPCSSTTCPTQQHVSGSNWARVGKPTFRTGFSGCACADAKMCKSSYWKPAGKTERAMCPCAQCCALNAAYVLPKNVYARHKWKVLKAEDGTSLPSESLAYWFEPHITVVDPVKEAARAERKRAKEALRTAMAASAAAASARSSAARAAKAAGAAAQTRAKSAVRAAKAAGAAEQKRAKEATRAAKAAGAAAQKRAKDAAKAEKKRATEAAKAHAGEKTKRAVGDDPSVESRRKRQCHGEDVATMISAPSSFGAAQAASDMSDEPWSSGWWPSESGWWPSEPVDALENDLSSSGVDEIFTDLRVGSNDSFFESLSPFEDSDPGQSNDSDDSFVEPIVASLCSY